ncbi:MAG: hypothetical protein LR015_09400 [Verrucomicrobia bacterium]|nr:hypothetical protein [Verrucomicrobiota bacterium]
MKLRIFFAVLTLLAVVLVLGLLYATNIRLLIQAGAVASTPMPETVEIRAVSSDSWEERIRTVGSVSAIQGTTIRAEAEGRIEGNSIHPWCHVEAGTVLVRQNTDIEQAQLAMAQAAARLAEVTVNRSRELLRRESIPRLNWMRRKPTMPRRWLR